MARRSSVVALLLAAVALALALALALPSFAEARGGKNGIPDGVVGVFGDDSKIKMPNPSRKESAPRSPSLAGDDPPDANPACDVCRWAWTNAQQALADPDTQAQVMRFAEETACGMLPSEEAQKCKEMAREYLPNAIAALESFDADEACGAVGFCPPPKRSSSEGGGEAESEREREARRFIREALVSSFALSSTSSSSSSSSPLTLTTTTSTSSFSSPHRLGGPACPACRLALNSVKLQLEDPANQKQLLDKAHKVCSTLPADSAELCASAVDENAAKLFAVVADFDCNTLCVVAGACPPPDPPSGGETRSFLRGETEEEEEEEEGAEASAAVVASELSDDPAVDLCGICTSVLTQLHEAVTDPDKQREAMATAARVCSALRRFRDECLGDVQQYGPLVINTVGQYVGPDLCAAAGLCDGPSSSSSSTTINSAAKKKKRTSFVDIA